MDWTSDPDLTRVNQSIALVHGRREQSGGPRSIRGAADLPAVWRGRPGRGWPPQGLPM